MSEYPIFIFIAILILGYGIFSRLAEKSIVTAPMVFVVVGILTRYFTGDRLGGKLVKQASEREVHR